MRIIYLIILLGLSFTACNNQHKGNNKDQTDGSVPVEKGVIYGYKVQDIDGEEFSFSELKGKKILIVNTASKCGFTPQFEQLQTIYDQYKSEGLMVVGFPTNDFLNQDPGTDNEIKQFCQQNYGVTFPMMKKITVKGDSIEPIYNFLTNKSLNGVMDSNVKWNFQKYLINEDGTLEAVYYSKVNPNDPKIINWIEK